MNEKIQLAAEDFDVADAKNYELYLEVGSAYYNYAVIDPKTQQAKTVAYQPVNIYNGLSDDILNANYAKTKITLVTRKFNFVPTELFHQSSLANFTKYINASENDEVFCDVLDPAGISVIYAFPKLQLDKVASRFPNAEIFPQMFPFYNAVNYAFSQIGFSQVFINFKSGLMEVIIIHQHEFRFYNIFEFQNDDEVNYFLLLSAQENNIKPASATVKVSGDLDINGELFKQILKHFPNTEITDQDSLPLFYQGLTQPVMPRFFSLLALHLCEL